MADQHLFDEVRVIDKNVAKIDDANADDVSVARQFGEHLDWALTQSAQGPAFETLVGTGWEFVAALPHTTMLSRELARVNAGEFCCR